MLSLLSKSFNLQQGSTIVDIGSGTGILSVLLLEHFKDNNVKVIGLEPNKEMRQAAEELLAPHVESGRFISMDGTAEATGLEDQSADLVVAAQAFHWFDIPRARKECQRIMKHGRGGVALIWNDRRGVQDAAEVRKAEFADFDYSRLDEPVTGAYELLLVRRGVDYKKVDHHKTVDRASLEAFFGPEGFKRDTFENPYKLSFEQLKGRLLSSSYTPQEGQEGYEAMIEELRQLFDKYQKEGKVDFVYDTRVFYGSLS